MSDQCIHCTVRGNLYDCKQTPCNEHESWYAVQMQEENKRLVEVLREFDTWSRTCPPVEMIARLNPIVEKARVALRETEEDR